MVGCNGIRIKKVALFIVAYNAQYFIQSVVERIPEQLISLFSEIFIIDDSSTDLTYKVAAETRGKYPHCNINIYFNSVQQRIWWQSEAWLSLLS